MSFYVKGMVVGVLVCFGVSTFGTRDNNKCPHVVDDMSSDDEYDVFPLPEDRLTFAKYTASDGFEQWKVDLAEFSTEDFQCKFYSKEDEDRISAEEKVIHWVRGTAGSEVFKDSWGKSTSNLKEAKEAIEEAISLTRRDKEAKEAMEEAISSVRRDVESVNTRLFLHKELEEVLNLDRLQNI